MVKREVNKNDNGCGGCGRPVKVTERKKLVVKKTIKKRT